MSYNLRQLREMPLEELVERHDSAAQNTSVGVKYYLEEIARRDAHRLAEEVARNTDQVADEVRRLFEQTEKAGNRAERLTLIVTVLTAANLVAATVAAVAAVSVA
jgi:hypothetical protein